MNTKKNVKANTAKKTTGAKSTTAKPQKPNSKVNGMIATLKSALPNITSKRLANKVSKALADKVQDTEILANLIREVVDSGKPKVAENEVKKTLSKKSSNKTETAKGKVITKKAPEKKEEEPTVQTLQHTGNKKPPMALIFPPTLTITINGEKTKLKLAGDKEFTSIKDILSLLEDEDKTLIFACFWSPRHIKEYDYGTFFDVVNPPKKFDKDLDLLQVLTVSERNGKVYAQSDYTEALYSFYEEDLKPIDDKNPYTGEKYSIRVSNGMEFAVYVAD